MISNPLPPTRRARKSLAPGTLFAEANFKGVASGITRIKHEPNLGVPPFRLSPCLLCTSDLRPDKSPLHGCRRTRLWDRDFGIGVEGDSGYRFLIVYELRTLAKQGKEIVGVWWDRYCGGVLVHCDFGGTFLRQWWHCAIDALSFRETPSFQKYRFCPGSKFLYDYSRAHLRWKGRVLRDARMWKVGGWWRKLHRSCSAYLSGWWICGCY